MRNYSAISGATTELLWSRGIVWPREVDSKELKLKRRAAETKTSQQPKIKGQTEHYSKHCFCCMGDLKKKKKIQGAFKMPISYPMTLQCLWEDALSCHVRLFITWFYDKKWSCFKTKTDRKIVQLKPLRLSSRIICDAISSSFALQAHGGAELLVPIYNNFGIQLRAGFSPRGTSWWSLISYQRTKEQVSFLVALRLNEVKYCGFQYTNKTRIQLKHNKTTKNIGKVNK